MLYATQTTLSVPALMGAIMCIGVATSNSILMVTFANQRRQAGSDAITAALAAGKTRLRPIVMTALAMVIGMLPMSLGPGRRRRAERAVRPSGDRWIVDGNGLHAVFRAGDVQYFAAQSAGRSCSSRSRLLVTV